MKFVRLKGQSSCTIARDTVLFDDSSKRYFRLNETGEFILQLLDSPHSAEELSKKLCEQFSGITPQSGIGIITRYLDELMAAGLVRIHPAHEV